MLAFIPAGRIPRVREQSVDAGLRLGRLKVVFRLVVFLSNGVVILHSYGSVGSAASGEAEAPKQVIKSIDHSSRYEDCGKGIEDDFLHGVTSQPFYFPLFPVTSRAARDFIIMGERLLSEISHFNLLLNDKISNSDGIQFFKAAVGSFQFRK